MQAWPEELKAVQGRFEKIPGVEVHAENKKGRLVVTIESENVESTAEILAALQNVEGVLSASLVYHHEESQPEKLEVPCETH